MQGDTVCDSIRPPERLDEQAWVLKKGCSEVLLCCVSSAARDSFLRADD
jgi:hypothetical protein